MGDTAVVSVTPTAPKPDVDPAVVLRAQVNRFWGASSPLDLSQGYSAKVPDAGPIDDDVAMRALLIVQKRAAEAYEADPGAGLDLLNKANTGFADPVGFVNKNLDMVTQTVTIYGDIHGLPKATLPGQILGVSAPLLIGIVGAIAVGALLLLRKG